MQTDPKVVFGIIIFVVVDGGENVARLEVVVVDGDGGDGRW